MKLVKLANNFHCVISGDKSFYFSYETLIAWYDYATQAGELLTTKFSKTTSQHQNYLRDKYSRTLENVDVIYAGI